MPTDQNTDGFRTARELRDDDQEAAVVDAEILLEEYDLEPEDLGLPGFGEETPDCGDEEGA